jgi:hypothetical protein
LTIFVDDMYLYEMGQFKRGNHLCKMSHMIGDTDEELHTFAERLGLQKAWFQLPGTYKRHYDVTMTVRTEAIALGAIPIRMSEMGYLIRNRKETGSLGTLKEFV